jgi:thymidylate synthase (FAD)
MPKLQTYDDMTVELIRSTEYPAELVALAQSITMNAKSDEEIPTFTQKKANFLIEAEHTSLFEHVVYTFLIQGVSRSFLAQITRQRTASPTSGSQHYQDYSEYPCTVSPLRSAYEIERMQRSIEWSSETYVDLLSLGCPREEARQVLPNAACVNYLWTIDARNLMFFLRQRTCNRNVLEMRIFANRVLSLVRSDFPALFDNVGPQCFMDRCKQGFLQCQNKIWIIYQ